MSEYETELVAYIREADTSWDVDQLLGEAVPVICKTMSENIIAQLCDDGFQVWLFMDLTVVVNQVMPDAETDSLRAALADKFCSLMPGTFHISNDKGPNGLKLLCVRFMYVWAADSELRTILYADDLASHCVRLLEHMHLILLAVTDPMTNLCQKRISKAEFEVQINQAVLMIPNSGTG